MCGLAGILNLNGHSVAIQDLKRMGETIAHRGPDGEGFYIKENLGLVHKRLAILDTSNLGAQPMSSKDGRWTIVFMAVSTIT